MGGSMENSSGLVAVASAWLVGLPDGQKVIYAAIGLMAVGFAIGAGGVASVWDTPQKQVETDSTVARHIREFNDVRRDLNRLRSEVLSAESADSLRWDKMLCLLTDGKDLPGAQSARACGL